HRDDNVRTPRQTHRDPSGPAAHLASPSCERRWPDAHTGHCPRQSPQALVPVRARYRQSAGPSPILMLSVGCWAAILSGLGFAAISVTSLRVIASPKLAKSWISSTKLPGPPVTFSR